MFITLFVICVILGVVVYAFCDEDLVIVPAVFAILFLIAIGFNLGALMHVTRTVPNKIAVYEEENARIEEQMNDIVNRYIAYENEVIDKVSDKESAITLITLYPELKSDKLVQTQLDVYVENNNKIKELRDSKASESVLRWWLYFGR